MLSVMKVICTKGQSTPVQSSPLITDSPWEELHCTLFLFHVYDTNSKERCALLYIIC